MSKSFLATLFVIALVWMFLLLGRLRTSSCSHVLNSYPERSHNEFEPVNVPLFGGEESRMIRIDREWGLAQPGDTLEIRFAGFATGSKSTITGGYEWIHRRGNQELSRGARSLALFWTLFVSVGVAPVILLAVQVGRRCLKKEEAPAGA